jgi:hypothetical protein
MVDRPGRRIERTGNCEKKYRTAVMENKRK